LTGGPHTAQSMRNCVAENSDSIVKQPGVT
jgi:hypothetical protein